MLIDNSSALFYVASLAFLFAVLLEFWRRTRVIKKHAQENPLSDRMEKAVHYFRQDKGREKITNDTYQELTGISDSTATRDLEKLEELGFLERKGKTSNTYYLFTPKTAKHVISHAPEVGS